MRFLRFQAAYLAVSRDWRFVRLGCNLEGLDRPSVIVLKAWRGPVFDMSELIAKTTYLHVSVPGKVLFPDEMSALAART
jgi:hypothetical protein